MKSTIFLMLVFGCLAAARGQETEKVFLSGTGSDHTVNWQFYCTEGRNSGKWTTIAVPSNWEAAGVREIQLWSGQGFVAGA
ncbi:hypothetical protein ACQ86N_33295 [Puia sp. P3]|uniref:hypothetical protein n=1 Tax=Puia sp. P3 TaxID=3423952 RepID=UPI003D66DC5A